MATFNLICSVKPSGAMARFSLMRDEEMKLKIQPHLFSFLHLYFVFLLLLLWGTAKCGILCKAAIRKIFPSSLPSFLPL